MSGPGEANAELQRFAADLRELFVASSCRSYRELARKVNFSHTSIAAADKGKSLPSLEVTLAFVNACGGDPEQWQARWRQLREVRSPAAPTPASPWPLVPVADGADPDAAGCAGDARTVHARRVALTGQPRIIGVVELRYCERAHAAWGRFQGYALLDRLAIRQRVVIGVSIVRASDQHQGLFEYVYSYDYHWGDLVVSDGSACQAGVRVHADGELVARGRTDPVELA